FPSIHAEPVLFDESLIGKQLFHVAAGISNELMADVAHERDVDAAQCDCVVRLGYACWLARRGAVADIKTWDAVCFGHGRSIADSWALVSAVRGVVFGIRVVDGTARLVPSLRRMLFVPFIDDLDGELCNGIWSRTQLAEMDAAFVAACEAAFQAGL